ncbi:hypothetical protein KCU81_g2125, partial [Aureobasidium melanogenum]|uniref:Uncharacterized protein n=1 Tax=Aureobasidium melanogenum (strain CBS 110374) TaxID=1043003 RepID=A0A074VNS7_AURM1
MQTINIPPGFPLELQRMIAAQADEEDIPTQRLVHSLWSRATLPRFLSSFGRVAFLYTRSGMENMMRACQHPIYGPRIHTLVLVVDCKRRNATQYQQLYNQALFALAAHGQPVCLGIRWRPTPLGEEVPPELASGRLVTLLNNKILPAARAAGLTRDDLLIELPDPQFLSNQPNTYDSLIRWLYRRWSTYAQVGGSCRTTIRFDNSITRFSRPPSLEFSRRPDTIECHGMLSRHFDAFYHLFEGSNTELALYNCRIPETFFRATNHHFTSIIMEGVSVYMSSLFEPLLATHPGLSHLRLKNLYEGEATWLSDGSHLFDVRGAHKLGVALTRLLEGYRGWEIVYWTCGDEAVKARMLAKWGGTNLGSGLLGSPDFLG